MSITEGIGPYDSLTKISGALAVLNVAIGRLLAHREDAESILNEMDAVIEMFENMAEEANARGSMDEYALLVDMAAGARHTGLEIGSETGVTEVVD